MDGLWPTGQRVSDSWTGNRKDPTASAIHVHAHAGDTEARTGGTQILLRCNIWHWETGLPLTTPCHACRSIARFIYELRGCNLYRGTSDLHQEYSQTSGRRIRIRYSCTARVSLYYLASYLFFTMHSTVCTVIDLFMCVCHILLINYYY